MKIFFLRLFYAVAAIFLFFSPLNAEPQQSFTIVEDGLAKCVILISNEPSLADLDAVKELNYWIETITGTSLKVIESDQWDRKSPYIAVGESLVTKENGWKVDDLGFEEAKVIIEPQRIGLLGNREIPEGKVPWPQSFEAIQPRSVSKSPIKGTTGPGSYYAVLELVQKEFNVRWIWPGKLGEVYLKRPTLKVQSGEWTWEPAGSLFRNIRQSYISFAKNYERTFGITVSPEQLELVVSQYDQWRKRQRMNRPEPIGSTLTFMYWWDRYYKKHPDWFAKAAEGRKALTRGLAKLNLSNPEVVDQVVNDWQRGMRTNPELRYYLNITPNDLRGFDTRKETRALDAPEMQSLTDEEIWISDKAILSDRYLYFWNAIAEKVAAINPDTRLMTFAYDRYRKPPLMGGRVAGNLILGFVGGEGFYPDEPDTLNEYMGWRQLGAQLYWRPNVFYCGHGIPYLYSKRLYQDVSTMIQNGLLGSDYDSMTGNWATQGLNYYIAAELHNRPEASYETLSSEYFAAFGKAASVIADYHHYFEQLTAEKAPLLRNKKLVSNESWGRFWRGHMRFVGIVFTDEVLRRGDELLRQAEEAVKDESLFEQERVAFVREGFEHVRLMADTFRNIGLHLPDEPLKLDYEKLEPLWKARQKNLLSLAYNGTILFGHEQIQFGIWSDFIHNSRFIDENVNQLPLVEGWQWASIAKGDHTWREDKSAAVWKPLDQLEPFVSHADEERVYRTVFDMPQLLDSRQYATLRLDGVSDDFTLWINGRQVPAAEYRPLKGRGTKAKDIAINILDYVKQAEPVIIEIKSKKISGRLGFAERMNLLTINH